MLRSHGDKGLGFFELAWIGLPMAIVGIAYLVLVAPRLLRERANLETEVCEGTVARDIHLIRIPETSSAVGRRVSDIEPTDERLQLMRLVRSDGTVARVLPRTRLREADRLTFRGPASEMARLIDRFDLEGMPVDDLPDLAEGADLREAVIAEGSELTGEKIDATIFADRYDAVVLGVVRNGKQVDELESIRLRAGDVLLLIARPEFARNHADSRHLHLLSGEEVESETPEEPFWEPTRARAGAAILAGVIAVAAAGLVHISLAALAGAVLMIGLGFLTPSEARRAIDWSVLIVIGSAIGLGAALEDSGGATLVAEGIAALGQPLGPRGTLGALILATMLFTLTVTNTAAVAIVIPVALAVAADQGLSTRPLLISVTVAASLAFATPLGYQTNLMVYGPGGYSFRDFVRVGLPLQLILALLAVFLIPVIWPL